MSMIKAVIFDMDGLLIDSEPLWHESEMAVFRQVGIELTKDDCLKTVGVRVDEIVDYWHTIHPWGNASKKAVEQSIINSVIGAIRDKGEPKEGAHYVMVFMKTLNVKIALASSSVYGIINAVVEKLNIRSDFDLIYSAEEEEYGKPHPGVYITTAKRLGVAAQECLVIEDSLNGVIAAKAAKMKCIAVPEAVARQDRRFAIADVILDSLADIDMEIWNSLNGK